MSGVISRALVVVSVFASISFSQAASAQSEGPPLQHVVQFRGTVVVGQDGNGSSWATFPTTVGGEDVRYVMVVDNGMTRRGREKTIEVLAITLSDDVVFNEPGFTTERVEVTLNPIGQMNQIGLEASGSPGSAATVTIFALQQPPQRYGGRSFASFGESDERVRFLTIHNAGPAPMAYRLLFYDPDGSLAGRSHPSVLAPYATITMEVGAIASNQGIDWQAGAVHVQWVSNRMTRMSAVATETQREPDESGNMEIVALALDDDGPFPITRQQFEDVAGAAVIPQ